MTTLTWLHLSDLHACHPRTGWDAARVEKTLVEDLGRLRAKGLDPDLIFFTGDAAFGQIGSKPEETLEGQFDRFATFLEAVRSAVDPDFPWENIFLVPGNHDVNRSRVEEIHTEWLEAKGRKLTEIVRLLQQGEENLTWRRLMERLHDYRAFLEGHPALTHLLADRERMIYGLKRRLAGLTIGIGGFNSAWSCGRDGEKGDLWMAGKFQQETLRQKLAGADFSIALMHHPPSWLVEQESPRFERRLPQDFRFLLHGHEHQGWVNEGTDGHTVLAAGACYESSEKENGYSVVRLDLGRGEGQVWLRRYDPEGGGWIPRHVHGKTDERGVWPLTLPWAKKLSTKVRAAPARNARRPSTVPPEATSAAASDLPGLRRFLRRLRAAHRDLPVAGFETKIRIPVRIDQVYIPLRAQPERSALASEERDFGAGREVGEDREIRFDDAFILAAEKGWPGLAVIGDPGGGKTTLLKHFILAATDPERGPASLGLSEDIVPVFVALRGLENPTAGLESALTQAVAATDPTLDAAAFAHQLMARGRLLILVDGLDELQSAQERAEVSRWLEKAVPWLPDSKFVVTSRYAGYKGDARLDGRFLELHIRDLVEPEARQFITAWYRAVETQVAVGRDAVVAERDAQQGAEELSERIFDEKDARTVSLRRLARNPLMLQILCLVHRDNKVLPERRVELYHECVVVLLERWRRAKKLPIRITAKQAFQLLQPLAWRLHAAGEKEAPLEEILPDLEGPLRELGEDPEAAEPFLAAIRDQSGVLVFLGEGQYAFLHLSFQEYLAARHVQDRSMSEPHYLRELASHFGEPFWREVILLAVGLDNPSLFEPLVTELVGQARLHQDAALAEDCLRDALLTPPAPFLRALQGGLEDWQERHEVLRLLKADELSGWPETVTDGASGREVIETLAREDDHEQVRSLARELVGLREPARPARRRRGRWAEPEPGEERIHEVDGSVLVYVPGGEYVLGSEDLESLGLKEEHAAQSKPIHRVQLSPFWIGKYPVTNEQYAKFLEDTESAEKPQFSDDRKLNQPRQPVVGVSWHEAQAYCRWAGLALPSEAQWEAAARGQDQRTYPWGTDSPTAEHANFGGNEGATTPVGAYPAGAGPFGTLDQAGNVWEWCADGWDENAYRERENAVDPAVPPEDDDPVVVLRGGAWANPALYLAAAIRYWFRARYRDQDFGFRVVLVRISEHA